jgi:hypothetical protein
MEQQSPESTLETEAVAKRSQPNARCRKHCTGKLISDKMFETTMSNVEREAWIALKDVISNFLGNYRDQSYKIIVNHMLDKFKELGRNMSLKVYFIDSHLD